MAVGPDSGGERVLDVVEELRAGVGVDRGDRAQNDDLLGRGGRGEEEQEESAGHGRVRRAYASRTPVHGIHEIEHRGGWSTKNRAKRANSRRLGSGPR